MYPKATIDALRDARNKDPRNRNKRDEVLLRLAKGDWVSGRELALEVALRYGARLYELYHDFGVMWIKRLDPERPKGAMHYQYRLAGKEQV